MASTRALAQAMMKVFEMRAPRHGIGEAERERERKQKRARLKRNRYHHMLLGRKDRGPSRSPADPVFRRDTGEGRE